MTKGFNGRMLHDMVDEGIEELQNKLDILKNLRQWIDPYTFYECDKGHGVYGIRSPDEVKCKMCKRLENTMSAVDQDIERVDEKEGDY